MDIKAKNLEPEKTKNSFFRKAVNSGRGDDLLLLAILRFLVVLLLVSFFFTIVEMNENISFFRGNFILLLDMLGVQLAKVFISVFLFVIIKEIKEDIG